MPFALAEATASRHTPSCRSRPRRRTRRQPGPPAASRGSGRRAEALPLGRERIQASSEGRAEHDVPQITAAVEGGARWERRSRACPSRSGAYSSTVSTFTNSAAPSSTPRIKQEADQDAFGLEWTQVDSDLVRDRPPDRDCRNGRVEDERQPVAEIDDPRGRVVSPRMCDRQNRLERPDHPGGGEAHAPDRADVGGEQRHEAHHPGQEEVERDVVARPCGPGDRASRARSGSAAPPTRGRAT